jgi:hypothetical protein
VGNHLSFFDGQDVAFMRTGYKGPPQGSTISIHVKLMQPLCSILQYTEDLVVYIPGKHVEAVRDCLQTSRTRLITWFGDLGLSLSANKSEMVVFSRKHENPQVSVRLGQIKLRNVTEFKYLGIIFAAACGIYPKKMPRKVQFYAERCRPILECPPSLSTGAFQKYCSIYYRIRRSVLLWDV